MNYVFTPPKKPDKQPESSIIQPLKANQRDFQFYPLNHKLIFMLGKNKFDIRRGCCVCVMDKLVHTQHPLIIIF